MKSSLFVRCAVSKNSKQNCYCCQYCAGAHAPFCKIPILNDTRAIHTQCSQQRCLYICIVSIQKHVYMYCVNTETYIANCADRVAQHFEIISETFPTNQNSAHRIYDEYHVINDESHENPGTPGTKLKVFRKNLKMLCHPICNWL